jgi:alkylhydroperoxidase/carboxymuconolactone decarboxylase family protein YurZ
MLENMNDFPDQEKQQIDKICELIREVLDGIKSPDTLTKEGTLGLRLKKLISLGSAIASQCERDVIASRVTDCLEACATPDEVKEVLRQAILMAEIPAETYTRIVHGAIDAFESQH